MPLTQFQEQIARLLATNRTPESHLAGGSALHAEPDAPRFSHDLDYFHDGEAQVADRFAADRNTLAAAGYTVDVGFSQPGMVRAVVFKGADATKIDWAHDSAWRFMPPVMHPDYGYMLHPVDLSVNKVLALAGRDEPRDFLDVIYVHTRHLSLGALCWAAAGKDPGFSPGSLLELLARKGRYHREDFAEVQLVEPPDLQLLKQIWLSAIADARALIARLPDEDAGCLYTDPTTGKFVTPGESLAGLRRHRGACGGIIPVIGSNQSLAGDADARAAFQASYASKPAADPKIDSVISGLERIKNTPGPALPKP